MIDKGIILKQLTEIIEEFNYIEKQSRHNDLSDIKPEFATMLATKAKAAISRITKNNSVYYVDAVSALESSALDGIKLRGVIGVVKALLSDLSNDYIKSLSELVHADIFSDFTEMAEYLHSEGYKDAAAVIIGSTLELNIKKLCIKNGIAITQTNPRGDVIPKKTDQMNSDLTRQSVYNMMISKQVTAWLDIRNNASHGRYSEYSADDVKLMLTGVKQFITNYPA